MIKLARDNTRGTQKQKNKSRKRKEPPRWTLFALGLVFFFACTFYIELQFSYTDDKYQARFQPRIDDPFDFSACLIIKDVNRVLPEWIAYHYEALPLRHLIVAVDPYSQTSPEWILDKFRTLPNLIIELWHDEDFLPNWQLYYDAGANKTMRHIFHRRRQLAFTKACIKSLKEKNRRWTAILDSDEFLTFNNYVKGELAEPWCCVDPNKTAQAECEEEFRDDIENGVHPRSRLPAIGETSLARYMTREMTRTDRYYHFDKPCMVLPRVFFSNKDSLANETHAQVPNGFDPNAFFTLRFRHHQPHQSTFPGKFIVDASRYDGSRVMSPHFLNSDLCVPGVAFVPYAEAVFRVHHYIGPEELYVSAKPNQDFKFRESMVGEIGGTNDDIRGWLESFVRRVGKEKALGLTEVLRAAAFEEMAKLNQGDKPLKDNVTHTTSTIHRPEEKSWR